LKTVHVFEQWVLVFLRLTCSCSYINALARISGPHEVTYRKPGGDSKVVTAEAILIAVGGRPTIPSGVPGAAEYAITSDDIFSLGRAPGKTLVVGASYIALECAGFLTGLGYDTTVAVRSILLRGFDRQCADKIGEIMDAYGTTFLRDVVPFSISKAASGQLEVKLADSKTGSVIRTEVYDTVLLATGRTPDTASIGLETVGVSVTQNGKISVVNEATNVPGIYAVGDCTTTDVKFYDSHWANPELTPAAIKAGQLLVSRLFGGGTETMDYTLLPTTVFTPTEYGVVGISEEEAVEMFGADDVEVYLSEFSSLEIQAAHRAGRRKGEIAPGDEEEPELPPVCLSKLVCRKSEAERVVGFHFVGPNAGEMTQGFALALRLGAKKKDFDTLVGIHPTDAESFCDLSVTRSSGVDWVASGGCGGGVCG
jgi:thioredoxin/glutathione reductase (selenoprotein)